MYVIVWVASDTENVVDWQTKLPHSPPSCGSIIAHTLPWVMYGDLYAAYSTTHVQVAADMNGSLDTTEDAPGRNSPERIQAIHASASAYANAAAMAARADVVAQQELLLRGGFGEEEGLRRPRLTVRSARPPLNCLVH